MELSCVVQWLSFGMAYVFFDKCFRFRRVDTTLTNAGPEISSVLLYISYLTLGVALVTPSSCVSLQRSELACIQPI
jgi:hypothetical protein